MTQNNNNLPNVIDTQAIQSLVPANKNLMIIPEKDGFTVLIPDGQNKIKNVKRQIRLSEKAKEIYNFTEPDKRNKNEKLSFEIGAPGYNRINQIVNLVPHYPKQGIDSRGNLIGYPYKEVDSKGKIKSLRILCIAIGYTEFGQLVAVPREIEYNIDDLVLEYLLAKRKKFPDLAVYHPAGQPPQEGDMLSYYETEWKTAKSGKKYPKNTLKQKKNTNTSWVEYGVDDIMSLYVDFNHPEIQSCFDQIVQLRKKALALVETQAQRNALKHHPAIALQTVEAYYDSKTNDWIAEILVSGYRGKLTAEELTSLADRIAKGEQLNNIEIQSESADVIKTSINDVEPEVNDETDLNRPEDRISESIDENTGEVINNDLPFEDNNQAVKEPANNNSDNNINNVIHELWLEAVDTGNEKCIINAAIDISLVDENKANLKTVSEQVKNLKRATLKVFKDKLQRNLQEQGVI